MWQNGKRGAVWNTIIAGDYGSCFNINNDEMFLRANEADGSVPSLPGNHFFFRNSIADCVGGPNFDHR